MRASIFLISVIFSLTASAAKNGDNFEAVRQSFLKLMQTEKLPVRVSGQVANLDKFIELKLKEQKSEYEDWGYSKSEIAERLKKDAENTSGKCELKISQKSWSNGIEELIIDVNEVTKDGTRNLERQLRMANTASKDNSLDYQLETQDNGLEFEGKLSLGNGIITATKKVTLVKASAEARVQFEQKLQKGIRSKHSSVECVFSDLAIK